MLEIRNLSVKYYNSDKLSVQDVSFSVKKGEIVAILGPSGCGKTTMINVLAGLLTSKEVEISGDINWKKKEDPKIRIVFQTPSLLPWWNVEKNIGFGLDGKKIGGEQLQKKVADAIEMVGLEGFEKYYPYQLSVGMRQRVNFARAIVCQPDILLLDEPFSALDVNNRKKLQKIFLGIIKEKNITAIFVTHGIEEALEIGDKLYVFFDGKKIKKGLYVNKFKSIDKKDLYINMEDYIYECEK